MGLKHVKQEYTNLLTSYESYVISKIGFNDICFFNDYIDKDTNKSVLGNLPLKNTDLILANKKDIVTIPTFEQVFNFFIKKYDLYTTMIETLPEKENQKSMFHYEIFYKGLDGVINTQKYVDVFKAQKEAINVMLKLIYVNKFSGDETKF